MSDLLARLETECPNPKTDASCLSCDRSQYDMDRGYVGYHLTNDGRAVLNWLKVYLTPDARGGWET